MAFPEIWCYKYPVTVWPRNMCIVVVIVIWENYRYDHKETADCFISHRFSFTFQWTLIEKLSQSVIVVKNSRNKNKTLSHMNICNKHDIDIEVYKYRIGIGGEIEIFFLVMWHKDKEEILVDINFHKLTSRNNERFEWSGTPSHWTLATGQRSLRYSKFFNTVLWYRFVHFRR